MGQKTDWGFLSFFVVQKRKHVFHRLTRFADGIFYNQKQEVKQSFLTETLYLDVYLAVNLLANLTVLGLLKLFLKLPAAKCRMVLGAFFGAAAACGYLVLGNQFLSIRLLYLLIMGGLMLGITFGKVCWKEFLRRFAGLLLVSAAVGGSLEAVCFQENDSFFSFLCCAAGVYFGGKAAILFFRRKQSLQDHLYEVTLYYQGRSTSVTALLDSGNRLYEPYGHQPVHVLQEKIAKKLCNSCNQMIYIPFISIGAARGMMPGIRIDEMEIWKDGRLLRRLERPWIGISRQPLSLEHHYEMLLHGEED